MFAVVTAAVLLAAACSSAGSGSPSASGSATGTGTPGASITGKAAPASEVGITATTIRVAMIADVNNSLEPGLFQKSVNAVKAWATIVNASGGLAGRKVVVDFCDSQLNPNATSNCVIHACQSDFAMVGTSANALEDLSDIDGCKNSPASRSVFPTSSPSRSSRWPATRTRTGRRPRPLLRDGEAEPGYL